MLSNDNMCCEEGGEESCYDNNNALLLCINVHMMVYTIFICVETKHIPLKKRTRKKERKKVVVNRQRKVGKYHK